MELRMNPRTLASREPDWSAAAVAGLAAGAVLMVLDLCWPLTFGDGNPWVTSHKVAALVLGPHALQSSGFDLGVVAVALLIHYSLGVFSGMVIGFCIARLQFEQRVGLTLAVGAGFGVLVYWFNFYVLTELFPWFSDMRDWNTLVGHLVFGISAALIYRRLSSTPSMPSTN
ncbi:MAG: hypothetical protein JOY60_03370 [Burkholderiaceae bacterium]|nr:hypothetical protein [Roseateles sp.]MBV8468889.1 hypothetical protein [Burkholderiaceae bacterium]